METFTNPVITSKAADNHYNDIISEHANVVQNLQEQAFRNNKFNQEKLARDSSDQAQRIQMEKDRMNNDNKIKELEIKRLALTSD